MTDEGEAAKWKDAVLSVLEGSSKDGKPLKAKKLRKLVLLSFQLDSGDKVAKKTFKRTVQSLEEDGDVTLDADGKIDLSKKRKRKQKDDKKSSKKKKKTEDEGTTDTVATAEENHAQHSKMDDAKEQNISCKGNPQGVTRLFLGNLPFAVDEASLEAFIPGVTHIKWITDKETGKFYGSAFVEMETSVTAADAVAKAGSQLLGRPIKINFAPARPGDIWPPQKRVISGGGTTGGGGQAGGSGIKAMSAKPENCMKLFIGNLSYDIDDDGITKFFENVQAEVKAVRWLHHKDTGDFKGVGFVEFWNTEACEKAATLNGKNLLGRPIRIDWTD